MGEVELKISTGVLLIHAELFIYGDAATPELALQIATDIETHWNEPNASIRVKGKWYDVRFDIDGFYEQELLPDAVWYNTNPRFNFFRVEDVSPVHISFVDGLGCNTGYFKKDNLLQTTTTAAHEFGHTLGLKHPANLDIRGKGAPGMMYPRGTLCDPEFQYDSLAEAGAAGGTMDPRHRKVLQADIESLRLDQLSFDAGQLAVLGDFSSLYHSKFIATE